MSPLDAGGALAVRSLLPPPWPELAPLVKQSEREGFRFLARLRREFDEGANRFDAPGETLLGCRRGAELVAVGGLNRDPWSPEPRAGRLRHLYVGPASRRCGVGRMLVDALVAAARPHFGVLLLRTDTPAAARCYEALGFAAVASPHATHRMALGAFGG
ncbi:MAG: GNAT family N-acetyltransferase [Longimicrobiaceae bacterium]